MTAEGFVVTYRVPEEDLDRPWGTWKTTAVGQLSAEEGGLAFCDKIITVNPGCRLSLQKHRFRQEDWRITEGAVVVHVGEQVENMVAVHLEAGDSIYIPCGAWHWIENIGTSQAAFAERQTGIYLDEKDIERIPTAKDPRGTDEVALKKISDAVERAGLARHWPPQRKWSATKKNGLTLGGGV